MAAALKNFIGTASIGRLADALSKAEPGFGRDEFERAARRGLGQLELKARIDNVALALAGVLPREFAAAASIVEHAVEAPDLGSWELWPVTVWAGAAGTSDVAGAAALMALITPRCSAEFGVRPLIDADPPRMLAIMQTWSRSSDEHLRRLASEGGRPLLPWAPRLRLTASDPGWALPVLDGLTDDPSVHVRRSVANHLNDISKLSPELALATAERWQKLGGEHTDSILRHGLRTFLKRGNQVALALVGLDTDADITVERLTVTPDRVGIGDTIEIDIGLRSGSGKEVGVRLGYAIEFAKRSGRRSRKVFTLGTVSLAPAAPVEFRRRYTFRPMSTRAYHPGLHAVEAIVNGNVVARAEFSLTVDADLTPRVLESGRPGT